MTRTRSRRRNPYRPGTASYARLRAAELKRLATLARAMAERTKSADARTRAKRRANAVRRALKDIKAREEFRSKLNEADRVSFGRLSIAQQKRLVEIARVFPDNIPKDVPDPFFGPKREALWRLSYSTRAGIRLRKSL